MIILNRKRIQLILSCLLIALFTFAVQTSNNNIVNQKAENTITTTATPASGKTIVIDAGHGIPDEGECLLH